MGSPTLAPTLGPSGRVLLTDQMLVSRSSAGKTCWSGKADREHAASRAGGTEQTASKACPPHPAGPAQMQPPPLRINIPW